ncbi:pyridoxal-phosphate dependent enzyme [Pseudoroseomonas ludipueritiae]|uniref:pyridoxal-phosphate dependent enzyme n=1 Tax=Pseudoroseomonas ludipueritiae TaxID=198093 RepID=UPI003463125A
MPFRLFMNPRHGVPGVVVLPESGFRRASAEIRGWPGRLPRPPVALPELAQAAGLASLHLGQVASPGYAYALSRLLRAELARRNMPAGAPGAVTFACAQGRGDDLAAIASAARRLGVRCMAFVEDGAVPGNDAQVLRGGYEEAMRHAGQQGWLFVSAWAAAGYTEVPRDIMQGDRVAVSEALAALPVAPTHVVVPGGQGGLAAATATQLRALGGATPRLVVAEPAGASPLMGEAEGRPAQAPPGLLAWQELERSAFAFLEAPDALGGVLAAAAEASSRVALGLDATSRLLVLGQDADPAEGSAGQGSQQGGLA